MKQPRHLADLYRVGKPERLNDESDQDPVEFWMQKLSSTETDEAALAANAARSRKVIATRNKESEEWLEILGQMMLLEREQLIDLIAAGDRQRFFSRAQAQVADREEWKENDYFQGMQDSWFGPVNGDGGLKEVFERGNKEDPRFAEAETVFNELLRYDKIVNAQLNDDMEDLKRDLGQLPDEELWDQGAKQQIELVADQAWMVEFRAWQLFYGIRDIDNHDETYFKSLKDVRGLQRETVGALMEKFTSLTVEASEGKDLPPTDASSQPSERPNVEQEAGNSSGQRESVA